MERSRRFDEMASDGFYISRMPFYAALYPRIRQAAFELGYALPIHGSLTKDLDVVVVPWVAEAAPFEDLVRTIVETSGGVVQVMDAQHNDTTHMPHGRMAVTILLSNGGYIDLSVMPRVL